MKTAIKGAPEGKLAGKAVAIKDNICVAGVPMMRALRSWKAGHTTGGSSSGSAALVAAGEVPMALGCDQAGSIRIPASFSGICGMKATHGLAPYTGIMPIEMTLDHCGPMTPRSMAMRSYS